MKTALGLALGATLLLSACGTSSPTPTAALQLSAGTYSQQGTPLVGTALLLRVALPGGAPLAQSAEVTVTGPSGWNNNAPLTITYPANQPLVWNLRGTVPLVDGRYQAAVVVAGQTLNAASASVSAASRLGVPGTVTVAESANQTFTLSWAAVNDAAVYLERVVQPIPDAPDELIGAASGYTTATSVTLPQSALQLDTSYAASVVAFNTAVNVEAVTLPAQFNASFGFLPAVFRRLP